MDSFGSWVMYAVFFIVWWFVAKSIKKGWFVRIFFGLIAGLIASLITGLAFAVIGISMSPKMSAAFTVSAQDIAPKPWPLTIPKLTVNCSLQPSITGEYKGTVYAMTGSSISKAKSDNTGWISLLNVTVPNPETPRIPMDISEINKYAIDKCKALGFWK